MRLRRNYSGLQYLVVENRRNDWYAGGAVHERAVVPSSALAETGPVRRCRERRNEDQVGARQRFRSEGLAARLSGRPPKRHQRPARLPQSPVRRAEGGPGLVEEDGQERAGEQPEREGHVGL